jgi:branched-chain amino acid transport system ATP-binding protein
MTARLHCDSLSAGRNGIAVVRDVDLSVDAGEVLALLGPNGAGKTTLLTTVAGLLPVLAGSVAIDGAPLASGRPAVANRNGVVLMPDTRALFGSLTVAENLRVARKRDGRSPRDMLDVFPDLEKRWDLRARALSGGEQQMLALARALVQGPRVLLIDELSLGLAPMIVESLFAAVRAVADDDDCAVVVVEQHVHLALEVADRVAVLHRGEIALRGGAAELARDPARLEQVYLAGA